MRLSGRIGDTSSNCDINSKNGTNYIDRLHMEEIWRMNLPLISYLRLQPQDFTKYKTATFETCINRKEMDRGQGFHTVSGFPRDTLFGLLPKS
jgi:hypothetical protein